MSESGDNIEIRSDEVQDIIGISPHWLLRSGLTIILCFVFLFLLGSWLFQYPDIIKGRVEVLSENPPARIVARTTGRIDQLFVVDKDTVQKEDVIAIVENTASHEDVFALKNAIGQLDRFFVGFDTLYYNKLSSDYSLGDIQPDFSSFMRLYNNYMSFIRLNFHPQKVLSLKDQVHMQKIYYDRLWSQRKILEDEYEIELDQYRRDSLLYEQDVLAFVDYKESETNMLQKKYSFNGARTELAQTQKEIIELEQDVVNAEKEFEDQRLRLQTELTEALDILKSRLEYWENAFVLEAPIDGQVTFTDYWSRNQQVKDGDAVFAIVPNAESKIIGRVGVPLRGAGKVMPGQRVNIHFDNFPYMEYGVVVGVIKTISLVPSNDRYVAEIELPQDLITNYNIVLPFSQEMKGDAEVITEDLRLIQRFFNPIRSLLKDKVRN